MSVSPAEIISLFPYEPEFEDFEVCALWDDVLEVDLWLLLT